MNVPAALSKRKQWVCWNEIVRDAKSTKVPFQPNGQPASSTNPATWNAIDTCQAVADNYSGIGFVFSGDDGLIGIDLDGCRDPETNIISDWAREIIDDSQTYAEVSPSQTGVKLFGIVTSKWTGKNKKPMAGEPINGKHPAIEIYQSGRYFTVTGDRISRSAELVNIDQALTDFARKYELLNSSPVFHDAAFTSETSVEERASRYIAKMPGAISGQAGSNAAFSVACVLCKGFGLSDEKAYSLFMAEYNPRCVPPWSEHEVRHKIRSAIKQAGSVGYLSDAQPEQWSNIRTPSTYKEHAPRQVQQSKPRPLAISQLWKSNPEMRKPIIKGLLRQGETCNIIASPKTGKSFLAGGLAWSVATGIEWMGFETTQGRVLIVDNELHSETLSARLSSIANEMMIENEYHGNMDVLSLRGVACGVQELRDFGIESGRYSLIVIDALYRTLPEGTSENDNAQMMAVYNHLDSLAAGIGAAIVVVHHSSKGAQGDKSLTDVGSGAGAISRAADTHLIIRPHEEDGYAVLEAVTRSFKSPDPITIEWKYPVWLSSGKAATVKRLGKRTDEKRAKEDSEADQLLLAALAKHPNHLSESQLVRSTGMGPSRVSRAIGRAVSSETIRSKNVKRQGRKVAVYSATATATATD
ncbi:MAG TPA: AAA family ATPase [Pirellula sp.]|nr:AAA family ATPase [Pirellula sp.]